MLPTRMLVAVDFSKHSDEALGYAAALATRLEASLVIAHVWTPPMIMLPEAVIPMTAHALHEALDKLERGLAAAAKTARDLGVSSVETALLQGEPWHEIVRAAADRRCDLIVVGTHGRGAIGHFLLGSVAEKIARKAECPVLVARPAR